MSEVPLYRDLTSEIHPVCFTSAHKLLYRADVSYSVYLTLAAFEEEVKNSSGKRTIRNSPLP